MTAMRKLTFVAVLVAIASAVPVMAKDARPPFPSISFLDLAGRSHPIGELLHKATVLTFWATWCGPCRDELPQLERMADAIKGRGGVVLAVNVDSPRPSVDAFVQDTKLSLPVYLLDRRTQAALGISRIPFTVLLDGEGGVVRIYEGYSKKGMQDLQKQLDELLPKTRGRGGKP
jgi:thiol-disulfide isomerase/thioredoxin